MSCHLTTFPFVLVCLEHLKNIKTNNFNCFLQEIRRNKMAIIETKSLIAMKEKDIADFLKKAVKKLQEYKEYSKKGEAEKAEEALVNASEFFGSLQVETFILSEIVGK